jgi:hypothetical protein
VKRIFIFPTAITLCLGACVPLKTDYVSTPTTASYTEAQISGLSAKQPYPNPDDICQIIRENDAIREPVDDGSFLIACPKHERGALSDRKKEGAKVIGHAKHWTILTVSAK